MDEVAVKEKPVEQFRQEIVDNIFQVITKEICSSVLFMGRADYLSVKLCEAKIEGLQKALSIMLEASTIDVK